MRLQGLGDAGGDLEGLGQALVALPASWPQLLLLLHLIVFAKEEFALLPR